MLTVPTQPSWQGSTHLSFKNSAPPMCFTTRLTGMPNYDLTKLRLSSGSVTMQIGPVRTTAATRYFNARGQEQDGPTGAAYIVCAKRGENGQVDVELRRAPGATQGKSLSLTWHSTDDHLLKLKELRGR
jgi:hypothetical protein